jgi:hypothetical protein
MQSNGGNLNARFENRGAKEAHTNGTLFGNWTALVTAISSEIAVVLRSCFLRVDGDGGGVDFEMEEPVAGDVAAVEFGGGKFPELGGFQGAVGEILAGAGSSERCFGHVA